MGGKDVDDPVDRLRGRVGVEGGERQVTGLGDRQGGLDRLEVPHLADEDHVRILPERIFQGRLK